MSYLRQLHAEHLARLARLNPTTPPPSKPGPRIIWVGRGPPPPELAPPPPKPLFPELKELPRLPWTGTHLPVATVIEVVAAALDVKRSAIRRRDRRRETTRPRQIAMYFAMKFCDRSYPYVGRVFGGFDHTTVMHATKKVELLIREDLDIAEKVDRIHTLLGQKEAAMKAEQAGREVIAA